MKQPFFTLALFVCSCSLAAQSTWQKTFGGAALDYCYDMQKTADGGFILGGTSFYQSYPTSFVVKTDVNGDTLWTASFGDTCGQYVNDIIELQGGGFLTCGGKFPCGNPQYAGNICRLDANGNVMWVKQCNHSEDPYPCIQSADGNFIVGGYVFGVGAGGSDACMMKLDAVTGDTIWSRTYGGTAEDWLYHIIETPDHGLIAFGRTASFGQGGKDIYVIRTDSMGNLLWSKTYGTGADEYAFGHAAVRTNDGGYIITGQGPANGNGIFLLKIDSLGNELWSKAYTGIFGHAIKQTADHGYLVAGNKQVAAGNTDAVLLKTDSVGNVLWSKAYGGSTNESGWLLDFANDGGLVTGGWTTSFTGSEDMYFIKTDANGNSGCNESNAGITSATYALVQATPSTQVLVGAATLTYPYYFTRGCAVNNLCSTVSVNANMNVASAEVYPDPFESEVTFRLPGEQIVVNASLQLCDVTGKIVREEPGINGNEFTIMRNGLADGIYFYQLISNGEIIARGKLIAN